MASPAFARVNRTARHEHNMRHSTAKARRILSSIANVGESLPYLPAKARLIPRLAIHFPMIFLLHPMIFLLQKSAAAVRQPPWTASRESKSESFVRRRGEPLEHRGKIR